MIFDVIITTFNRRRRATTTIQQLLEAPALPIGRVLLVDSSDGLSQADYPDHPKVRYIHSSHKNQPYQRFLGYKASTAESILFLDDDMDLLDMNGLREGMQRLQSSSVAAANFDFSNNNAFLSNAPRTLTAGSTGSAIRFLARLSGAPTIPANRLWLCGIRGPRVSGHPIEYVSGGAFAAKRSALYRDFNFQLFDLFEQRQGMGEDAAIGYTLAKQGTVLALEGLTFDHNDQRDSTYTPDLRSFNERVAFSRLFLSSEYTRLNGGSQAFARAHFMWWAMWRWVALAVSLAARPSRTRFAAARGWMSGVGRTVTWRRLPLTDTERRWRLEAEKDLGAE